MLPDSGCGEHLSGPDQVSLQERDYRDKAYEEQEEPGNWIPETSGRKAEVLEKAHNCLTHDSSTLGGSKTRDDSDQIEWRPIVMRSCQ